MLELRKGLECMCFIGGECVAHEATPPFQALPRHHKLIIAASLNSASILFIQLFRQL